MSAIPDVLTQAALDWLRDAPPTCEVYAACRAAVEEVVGTATVESHLEGLTKVTLSSQEASRGEPDRPCEQVALPDEAKLAPLELKRLLRRAAAARGLVVHEISTPTSRCRLRCGRRTIWP